MNKAMIRLMGGFRRFKEKYFDPNDEQSSIYRKLASSGQTPKTLLIGCSDSRVDPAILTGAGPGEIFVIRNVANLVPPYEPSAKGFRGTSSAIEFAITGLKVENIVILGHRQCGGIRALITQDSNSPSNFIGQWMSIAEEAKRKVLADSKLVTEDERWRAAEMEALKVSVKNLKGFPFVQSAIEQNQLNIVGVYFDLELGQLWELDSSLDSFSLLPL